MASGSKRIVTGAVTAVAFLLVVGGLVAYGAGFFDSAPDSNGKKPAEKVGPTGSCCPATGYSDKSAVADPAIGTKACTDDAGCCPSMAKSRTADADASAAANATNRCGGGADSCEAGASAGCGAPKKDCGGQGSCDSCPAGN